MRRSLMELGLIEYSHSIGNKRNISSTEAQNHFKEMATNLTDCDLVVVVICSHGRFSENVQRSVTEIVN